MIPSARSIIALTILLVAGSAHADGSVLWATDPVAPGAGVEQAPGMRRPTTARQAGQTWRMDFPAAGSPRVASVSIIDGRPLDNSLRALTTFLDRGAPRAEIQQVLATVPPGRSVFVKQQFQRVENPWRLGETPQPCRRNEDCTVLPKGHYWLIRPRDNWRLGPVIAVGDGSTTVRQIYPNGRPLSRVTLHVAVGG